MKARTFDSTYLDQLIEVLESMHQHCAAAPDRRSDALYHELLARHYRNIRDAHSMGKKLIYHTAGMPTEILYAMDVVPCGLEALCGSLTTQCGLKDEALATAKAYGLASELCSLTRLEVGCTVNGWLPQPDGVIGTNLSCDIVSKGAYTLGRLWSCPNYFFEHNYQVNEREIAYVTSQLEGMVAFLEEITGRKMDWARLAQAMENSREAMLLESEVGELRKAMPSPLNNRTGMFAHLISSYCSGAPEAVQFFRVLRDEAQARVARGVGTIQEEKYRLLLFFEPPVYGWKLLDWLEREHGAKIVFEPLYSQWGAGEWEWDSDPAKLLESLAVNRAIRPVYRHLAGPIEPLVEDMVRGAQEYNVEGVMTFCHVGCRATSPCNRLLKDTIRDELELPFFAIEHDMADPAFASLDEMRDKIEGFLEMIDERR
ncbi:MAG: 2-hydroxyacyl-CoA dehydratase [Chloroflexota bacterium]|nr:MAG: 2-hydroxyacyl-CoA dehydratase [Chloroflexota bacterium]